MIVTLQVNTQDQASFVEARRVLDALQGKVEAPAEAVRITKPAKKVEKPAQEVVEVQEVPKATHEEVLAALKAVAKSKGQKAARDLLTQNGVARISEIAEDKLGVVLLQAQELVA